jgi:hypothetical protein
MSFGGSWSEIVTERVPARVGFAFLLLFVTSDCLGLAPQGSKDDSQASSSAQTNVLQVHLQLQDGSPFSAAANVQVVPHEGSEIVGRPSGSDGEIIFADVPPGDYTVEASAAGFLGVRQKIQVDSESHLLTLFLIMKPRLLPEAVAESPAPAVSPPPNSTSWLPPDIDEIVPGVEKGVECPLSQVVGGASHRMKELVENLQKFTASEQVKHFNVDASGTRGKPDARTFDYLVIITLSRGGVFQLDEYRNSSLDPAVFPAQFATTGLPAMALILHPTMVSDFSFACEGLGRWDGQPAWQLHFAQRPDRPNRIRAYVISNKPYPLPLKGRVWIDAGTYQVRRLESELIRPLPEIALTQERMAIEYGPVQFRTHAQQLWLPLRAEVYWERKGHRYYRSHTFSNFKIFEVESAQQIQAPKESYCFTNTSDHEIDGTLTVSPIVGTSVKPLAIYFGIPSRTRVCKFVGPGKDVSIPVDQVGSATFRHSGPADSIKADANLIKESTLDLVPEGNGATVAP